MTRPSSTTSKAVLEALAELPRSATELACFFRAPPTVIQTRLGYLYRCRRIKPVGIHRRTRKWKATSATPKRGSKSVTATTHKVLNALSATVSRSVRTVTQLAGLSQPTVTRTLQALGRDGLAHNTSSSKTRAAWILNDAAILDRFPTRPKHNELARLVSTVAKNPGISSRDILHRWRTEQITSAVRQGLITAVRDGTARRLYPPGSCPAPSRGPSWHDQLLTDLMRGPLPLHQVTVDRSAAKLLRPLVRLGWAEVLGDQLLGYGLSSYTGVAIDPAKALTAFEALVGPAALADTGLARLRPALFRRIQRADYDRSSNLTTV